MSFRVRVIHTEFVPPPPPAKVPVQLPPGVLATKYAVPAKVPYPPQYRGQVQLKECAPVETLSSTVVSGEMCFATSFPDDFHTSDYIDTFTDTENTNVPPPPTPPPPPFTDDFDDDVIGPLWDKMEVQGGHVYEANDRLEMSAPATNDMAGVVSKDPHDLADHWVEAEIESHGANRAQYIRFVICLTKRTDWLPYYERDWYQIIKKKSVGDTMIDKRVAGGAVEALYAHDWVAPKSVVRIELTGGDIKFYEDGGLLYSEAYELPSTNLYVYIHNQGADGYNGWSYAYYFDSNIGS